jgi:O-antigen/teichoic acid export membrane protein
LLIASRNQTRAAQFTVLGLAVNITLAIVLVPHLGIEGAAWARFTSNLLVFALGHLFVQRHVVQTKVGPLIWRPILASLAMGGVVAWARASLWLSVLLGIATYIVLIVALGGVSPREFSRLPWTRPGGTQNTP